LGFFLGLGGCLVLICIILLIDFKLSFYYALHTLIIFNFKRKSNVAIDNNKLDTGYIAVFSGKSKISKLISFATRSKWTHVGMIVRAKDVYLPRVNPYEVCIWESTTLSTLNDLTTGKNLKGVQTVKFSDRVAEYDGDVAVIPLKRKLTIEERAIVKNSHREFAGVEYEKDKMELFNAAYDGLLGENEPDLSTIFCTELATEVFKRLNIIKHHVISNELTPADYYRNSIGCTQNNALDTNNIIKIN